jgi:hypothetical protein
LAAGTPKKKHRKQKSAEGGHTAVDAGEWPKSAAATGRVIVHSDGLGLASQAQAENGQAEEPAAAGSVPVDGDSVKAKEDKKDKKGKKASHREASGAGSQPDSPAVGGVAAALAPVAGARGVGGTEEAASKADGKRKKKKKRKQPDMAS